jgi:predicted SprT family Zn-dependent metalloprotease
MGYKIPKSEKEFIDLFNKISLKDFNWKCNIPISINTRLYSTLGQYVYDRYTLEPLCFEFSLEMINGRQSLKEVINTIRHELVHWYTDTTTKKNNGHNDLFRENCKKFGVTDIEIYEPRKRLPKDKYYEAKCLGCNRVVAKCKSIHNLKKYMNRYGGTVCGCGFGKRYIEDKGGRYIYNHGEHYGTPEQWLDYDCFTKDMKIIFCKEEGK